MDSQHTHGTAPEPEHGAHGAHAHGEQGNAHAHEHAHGHAHAHSHGVSPEADRRYLWAALGVLAAFMVAEVVVAWLSGSLALLSDAGHMLSDAAALALALWVSYLAERPARGPWTYGFRRAEVLSGLGNGVTLLVVAAIIIVEAIRRLIAPPEVIGWPVIATACAGIVVNLVATALLARGNHESLNIRGAYQHLLTDLYGFIGTALAGIIIMATGWARADVLASLFVAALMIRAGWALVREAGYVLLEAAPSDAHVENIRQHLREVEHVADVHDLHVWQVSSGSTVATAHVALADECTAENYHDVLDALQSCLAEHFGITHATFQCEPAEHAGHEGPTH